jgi:hypothetical protein
MKYPHLVAAGALACGVAIGAPAHAATVTDFVTFADSGAYTIDGNGALYPYNPAMSLTGSFTITFDPTLYYPAQTLAGFISGLNFTLTDPFFPGLTLNPITQFTFNGGTLTLLSNPSAPLPNGTDDITITLNGLPWGGGDTGSGVYYSQVTFNDTVTSSGTATISATPLPAALPLFAGGLGILGLVRSRRKKSGKQSAVAVA